MLKLGLGRLRLGAPFDRSVVAASGALRVEADLTGSVSVINPGVLESSQVTRHVGALNLIGGTVAPGGPDAAALLDAASLNFDTGSFAIDLLSSAPTGYDQLTTTGELSITGPIELKIHMGYDPIDRVDVNRIVQSGDPFTPSAFAGFSYNGRVLQNFEEFLVTEGASSQFFGIHYVGDGTVELFAAPEPGSAILVLGGSLCLAAQRRRRSCSAA